MIKRNFKKQYTLKSMAFILALFMVTGLFTACGKADREDTTGNLSGNVTTDSATEDSTAQEEIPESLSYTIESGDIGAVKVEAEVCSEGYGQVPTYKLKKRDKNDEWVKSYAERLFDNGEYINVKPYDFCSRKELESEKQFWENRLVALDEGSRGYERVKSEISDIEYVMEHFSENNYVEYPEGKLVLKKSNEGSGDNSTSYNERAQLKGEVDGNVWLLNYDYGAEEREGKLADRTIRVPVLYGTCVEKADYISGVYGMDSGIYENICDREKAESKALKLLDRLGFDNMECIKMTGLHPNYSSGNADYLDGYCIIYGPSLNGIKIFSGISVGINAGGGNITVQPYVIVLVNSEGVFGFCIMEDYVLEDVLSENSQMLSFSQIDGIAHGEFQKMMKEDPYTSYNMTKVKFEYLCVSYDGLSYAMLPVWIYYTERIEHGDTKLLPGLIINGLDGEIIHNEYIYCNWEYYFTMTH